MQLLTHKSDLGADKLKYEPPKPKGAKRRSRKQVQESDDDEEGGEEESGEEDEIPASAQIVKEEPEEQDEDEQDVIEEPQLEEYSEDELRAMDKDELKAEIALLEEGTQNVNVDLSVLQEYRRRVEEHAARKSDLDEAIAKRESAKARCDELRKRRLDEFMEGFSQISLRLKEMYQMITMGGNAELELVDSLDPFSEGILFSVMPPKKSWKNIANLSGGEKVKRFTCLFFFFANVDRPFLLSPSSLLSITTNPRHCMLWTKSTRHWISATSQLSPRTSRNVQKMRNSLSFLCGTTCLNLPQGWWEYTKSIIWYVFWSIGSVDFDC